MWRAHFHVALKVDGFRGSKRRSQNEEPLINLRPSSPYAGIGWLASKMKRLSRYCFLQYLGCTFFPALTIVASLLRQEQKSHVHGKVVLICKNLSMVANWPLRHLVIFVDRVQWIILMANCNAQVSIAWNLAWVEVETLVASKVKQLESIRCMVVVNGSYPAIESE